MDYQTYITSKEWQDRRWKKIRDDGTVMVRCESCLGFFPSSSINVHHLTYENLGREENRYLQILCKGCHERAHGIQITKKMEIAIGSVGPDCDPIMTGFTDLDRLTGGIQAGEMVVLGSRPSVGKSALALCVARHAAINLDLATMFITFEMKGSDLVCRLVSQASGIPVRSLYSTVTEEEAARLDEIKVLMSGARLYINDAPSLSVDEIVANVKRRSDEHPIRLLVVDYVQLLDLPDGTDYRDLKIAAELRRLRLACKTMGVACLVLTALKRSAESREDHIPTLADFYAGGEIEHDADQVWALWRRDYHDTDKPVNPESKLLVLKNRRAQAGSIRLTWHPETVTFRSEERGDGSF